VFVAIAARKSIKHVLYAYRKARCVWRKISHIRQALGLYILFSWREAVVSILPGSFNNERLYTSTSFNFSDVSDILRSMILWHLWWTRNWKVFEGITRNVTTICSSAYRDFILAGMAQRNYILTFLYRCSEDRQHSICLDFQNTWSKNNVFCSQTLHKLEWQLSLNLPLRLSWLFLSFGEF